MKYLHAFLLIGGLANASSLSVTKFSLVDADADLVLIDITQGAVIDLSPFGDVAFNIIAVTEPPTVGSVIIETDLRSRPKIENMAPYALNGDNRGDYNGMVLDIGEHVIKAIPYSERNGGGTAGDALGINFELTRSGPCLQGDVVTLDGNGCSVTSVLASIAEELDELGCSSRDPTEELTLILGTDETTATRRIRTICATKWAAVEEGYFLFENIANEEPHDFVKAYYDGGTNWNDLRETTDLNGNERYVLADYPGSRINQIYNGPAQNSGITYPENINLFNSCDLRAVMCCFVRDRQAGDNNGNCAEDDCFDKDPADNVDICYSDMSRSLDAAGVDGGFALYPNGEGASHCHGFAWSLDDQDTISKYIGNNLFYVSMYDHFSQRGYVNPVPGSPMCGCVEHMPVVTRSDCTQLDVDQPSTFVLRSNGIFQASISPTPAIDFNACQGDGKNNDLAAYYKRLVNEGKATEQEKAKFDAHIVGNGNCEDAVSSFMKEKGYERI